MADSESKVCSKCGEQKPLDLLPAQKQKPSRCKGGVSRDAIAKTSCRVSEIGTGDALTRTRDQSQSAR
jgi:hypothetical protein